MAPGILTGPSIGGGECLHSYMFSFISRISRELSSHIAPILSYANEYMNIALISATNGSYIGLQCFVGGTIALGTVFAVAARFIAKPSMRAKF